MDEDICFIVRQRFLKLRSSKSPRITLVQRLFIMSVTHPLPVMASANDDAKVRQFYDMTKFYFPTSRKSRTFAACNRNQNKKNNQNFFFILFILIENNNRNQNYQNNQIRFF